MRKNTFVVLQNLNALLKYLYHATRQPLRWHHHIQRRSSWRFCLCSLHVCARSSGLICDCCGQLQHVGLKKQRTSLSVQTLHSVCFVVEPRVITFGSSKTQLCYQMGYRLTENANWRKELSNKILIFKSIFWNSHVCIWGHV